MLMRKHIKFTNLLIANLLYDECHLRTVVPDNSIFLLTSVGRTIKSLPKGPGRCKREISHLPKQCDAMISIPFACIEQSVDGKTALETEVCVVLELLNCITLVMSNLLVTHILSLQVCSVPIPVSHVEGFIQSPFAYHMDNFDWSYT
ncbi:hypothetical protein CW304_27530 [Bacillus sp. UFRGS-B20]|nr:hypothetical protein CW304_27530 [Bacillus sp. UFRGS-B20]